MYASRPAGAVIVELNFEGLEKRTTFTTPSVVGDGPCLSRRPEFSQGGVQTCPPRIILGFSRVHVRGSSQQGRVCFCPNLPTSLSLTRATNNIIKYVSGRSPCSLPGQRIPKSAHTILLLKEDQARSESNSGTADDACIPLLEVCFDSGQSYFQPGWAEPKS